MIELVKIFGSLTKIKPQRTKKTFPNILSWILSSLSPLFQTLCERKNVQKLTFYRNHSISIYKMYFFLERVCAEVIINSGAAGLAVVRSPLKPAGS